MKRPIKIFIYVLSFVMIFLVSETVIFNYMYIPQPYYGRDVYAFSDFPGAEVFGYIEETAIYTASIHYPKMKIDNLNKIVLDYVSKQRQEFIDELEFFDKEELSKRPAHFNLSFIIVPFGEKLYSYIFTVERYFNDIRSDKRSDIFLADTHRLGWVRQPDIIDISEENREKIYYMLLNELQKREDFDILYFPETLKEKIVSPSYDFHNVYFTQDEVVFHFDKYEVAAGGAGMVEISLPKGVVIDMFTQRWQERLGFEVKKEQEYFDYEKRTSLNEEVGSSKKTVALIFTGGPDLKTTPDILDVLSRSNVHATFFVLGQRAVFYPGIICETVSRGHEIGNFSYGYRDFSILSKEEISNDISFTNDIIKSACSVMPKFFAPPFGSLSEDIVNEEEMNMITWNLDYDGNINDISDNVIIRFHDVDPKTADRLIPLIERLRYLGYRFMTVSEFILSSDK